MGRGTVRRTVEGCARCTGGNDCGYDVIDGSKHFTRRNAERLEPQRFQFDVSLGIPRRPVAAIMRLAVNLDRQARRQTGKVEAVRTNRMLPAEPIAPGSQPQGTPQHDLGRVPGPAFAAGELDGLPGCGEDPSTPRLRRAVPLPVPGR